MGWIDVLVSIGAIIGTFYVIVELMRRNKKGSVVLDALAEFNPSKLMKKEVPKTSRNPKWQTKKNII